MPNERLKLTTAGLSKLEYTATTGRSWEPDQLVEAIVKVAKHEYVPSQVELRARIDGHMFTATCEFRAIAELEADPEVESVAVSRPLQSIDEQEATPDAERISDSTGR